MYQHAMKAPDEMRELHKQFYDYVKGGRHEDALRCKKTIEEGDRQ